MGLEAVPLASILPPLATINVEASAPEPGSAFITVPAGIVNVAPSPTTTLPLSNQILSLDKVLSDVGIVSASEIREIISQTKIDPNKDLIDEINNILKNYIISIMKPLEKIEFFQKKEKLNATLISGVNGVGKTTTIGKISKILKGNGNKVMLAASDTFRAAAIEQLENWANKVDVQITKSSQGSDPASVAYKAIEAVSYTHLTLPTKA